MGSSPRVRGRLTDTLHRRAGQGLIPACAGQTVERRVADGHAGAHPRVCGADGLNHWEPGTLAGSSPRVRGRPQLRAGHRGLPGLIPACAGQTSYTMLNLEADGAHPRVCGADTKYNVTIKTFPGSSPRVRGRQYALAVRDRLRGLIPACAGQTDGGRCGKGSGEGSSPRVRGRHHACQASPTTHRAHPRVCGADIPEAVGRRAGEGLIPACAGQTRQTKRVWSAVRAHPRVCGADCRLVFFVPASVGLIPACAGQTTAR